MTHVIGNNRFFWGLVEDCIWYKLEDVLSLIPEPKNVTKRHKQIDPDIWKSLEKFMDNDVFNSNSSVQRDTVIDDSP
jgi:hypothetical protein